MPGKLDELAENKLIILFLLYQMDMPMSTAQLIDFAVGGEYMDYFSFQQYIAQLAEAGMVESSTSESNSTTYSITTEGEEAVRIFSPSITYSLRTAICKYVLDNKKRIKREFEVVANYFYKAENDYIVKCGIYDEDMALMEISVSVVSKEQAKVIKRNWKEHVTDLYGKILSNLLDENTGNSMQNKLKQSFEYSHVSTKYCEDEEE